MRIIEKAQSKNFQRRVKVLAESIAQLLPNSTLTILDVGCGDGFIDRWIMDLRSNVTITGCDILVRNQTHIPVMKFNGETLPFINKSFDYTFFVDVLHHISDPSMLLGEAKRVSRRGIIIKDHITDKVFARQILRFMDDAGNRRYQVNLPYNYWSESRWHKEFSDLDLHIHTWITNLPIYPWWAYWLFGSGLHILVKLEIKK